MYPAGAGYPVGDESNMNLPDLAYNQSYAPPPGSPPPFDKSLPAYGGHDGDKVTTKTAEDPFADYEEPPRR